MDADRSLCLPGISHSLDSRLVTRQGHEPKKHLTLSRLLEHFRLAIDLVHLLFTVDDHAGVGAAPIVRGVVGAILDVLYNPYKPLPAGEIMYCQTFQEFVVEFL